jgi:hypothetical protein
MSEDTIDRIRSLNPFPADLPAPPIEEVLTRIHGIPPRQRATRRPRLQRTRSTIAIAASVVVVVAIVAGVILAVGRRDGNGDRGTTQPGPLPSVVQIPTSLEGLAAHFALLKASPVRVPAQVAQSFGGGASTERSEGHRVIRPAGVVWVAPDDALGLCLAVENPAQAKPLGSACAEQSQAKRVGVRLSAANPRRGWVAGVVPDGITAIRLRPAGRHTITVPVVDNVYAYRFRRETTKGPLIDTITDVGSPSTPKHAPQNPSPGGDAITDLAAPVAVTGVGTQVVELGPQAGGTTSIHVRFDCLTAGTFRFPGAGSMVCDRADVARRTPPQASYTRQIAPGQHSLRITATSGARWRLVATYVSVTTTAWRVNASGQTYGVENSHSSPTLIAVEATNHRTGYVYAHQLNRPAPKTIKQAPAQHHAPPRTLTVYASDGKTPIGKFVLQSGTSRSHR